jgi:NitT/TauT family transport system substrate-binding protein
MSHTTMTRARASALLFGGAALSASSLPGRAQTNATIRIATLPIDGSGEAYYAKDSGFFAKAGLSVDIQPMLSSSAIAAAVSSNAVDIGYGNIDVLAALHRKGIPVVPIAPANGYDSPGGTVRSVALLLPANSPVQRAKDLNGKIIAVGAVHSVAQITTEAWIDQHGGDASTVKFIEVPIPAMPAALDANRTDAALVVEPFLGVAAKSHRVLSYGIYDAISKHFILAAWFTTPQWAKDHPDLVKGFATVMRETAAWANANPDLSGAILSKYSKIEPAVIATIARARFAEQLTPASMQPLIDAAAKYNGFSTFPAQELMNAPVR